LQRKIPVVTMVWVVRRFRLKAPPDISSFCISPLTSSGKLSRASWASQTQNSATLSPQPGETTKFRKSSWLHWGWYIYIYIYIYWLGTRYRSWL